MLDVYYGQCSYESLHEKELWSASLMFQYVIKFVPRLQDGGSCIVPNHALSFFVVRTLVVLKLRVTGPIFRGTTVLHIIIA